MSRPLLSSLTDLAWEAGDTPMDSISILDPSRLRIPIPGRGGEKRGTNSSWPVVPALTEEVVCDEVRLDIPVIGKGKLDLKKDNAIKAEGASLQLDTLALGLAYAIFGVSLALCNLLEVQSSGRTCCAALSPLPVLCLALQAATAPSRADAVALLVCALCLPCTCLLGNLPLTAAFIICMALALLVYTRRKGLLAYVCCVGAVLSLGQTAVAMEPMWGISISLFFLGLLCVVSCERIFFKVWT